MRYLLLASALFSVRLFAATGDILVATNRADGWSQDVKFSTMATNGVYALGFGTNNTITALERMRMTVVSPGFDSTGTSNNVTRTVWGTLRVRKPYPNNAYNDDSVSGSDVISRVSLSDWIYASDLSATCDYLTNLYVASSVTNQTTLSIVPVNASTIINPKPDWYWALPPWDRITNTTYRVQLVAFSGSAANGTPAAAVKIVSQDEHSHAVTNFATMAPDWDYNKTAAFWGRYEYYKLVSPATYYVDQDWSSFTAHDQIRTDVFVYPRVGTNFFNTFDNTYLGTSPFPAAMTNLYDPNNNYSGFIAVVSPSGSDSNGRATNTTAANVSSGNYFLTIAGAANFLAASNNAFASPTTHNDVGGSYIYVKTGVSNFAGGTVSAGSTPKCVVTCLPYPGDTFTLSSDTGTDDITDRVKIQGANLQFTGNQIPFSSCAYLWLDQCNVNSSGTGPFQATLIWATRCNITNLTQGIGPFSTSATSWFCRGCDLNGFHNVCGPKVMIGCVQPGTNGAYRVVSDQAGQGHAPDWGIIYNNYFGGMASSSEEVSLCKAFTYTNGFVFAQNVVENTLANLAAAFNIGSSDTLQFTNIIFWHNTGVGTRWAGIHYNETGSAAAYRWICNFRNNIFDNTGFKTDDFLAGENGGRIGNWPVIWNVGWMGNCYVECNNMTGEAAGNFNPEFPGINSYHPVGAGTNDMTFPQFVAGQSLGRGTASGGGNYITQNTAPQYGMNQGRLEAWVLPYDILGMGRGSLDGPGAYANSSPRKCAGFFATQ